VSRRAAAALLAAAATLAGSVPAPARGDLHLQIWADRDDDDADGTPDGEQTPLPGAAFVDLISVPAGFAGAEVVGGAEHARLVTRDGGVVPWGRGAPGKLWLQGLSAGRVELADGRTPGRHVTIDVRAIDMRDGDGTMVDMARSHASMDRTPPSRIDGAPDAKYDDPDALRVSLAVPDGDGLAEADREIAVESVSALGVRLDAIPKLVLSPAPCARPEAGVHCWASAPLRFVSDEVDRNHPLVAGRSIRAELGGAIVLRSEGHKAQMIRVLGPRNSPVGPIGRLRATLRPFVLRVAPGAAPAIGSTDAGAVSAVRAEVGAAAAIWGQCGVSFGDPKLLDVRVVDPPPPHLVAVGDDMGLPASGGEIRLRAEGKSIVVPVLAGAFPEQVARDLSRALERAGLSVVVSPNARIAPAAGPSVDLSVHRRDGALATLEPLGSAPVSSDPSLTVRIGSVELHDGLEHFNDMDAMAGTLEERTLLKAFDDGDPSSVEVVIVPLFAGGGRIGESFIGSDLSSMRNAVILDRAGIRSRKSSLALAHELGHVLLDLPGHPDDYGVDTPTLLMDSDAADASPFGPRRITVDQCARVVRQAGPAARVPLLSEWRIGPLPITVR
jgi:hypothetical protein